MFWQSLVDRDFHQQRDGVVGVFADANGRVYSIDSGRTMLQPIRDAAEVAHMRLTLMARALPGGGTLLWLKRSPRMLHGKCVLAYWALHCFLTGRHPEMCCR
jgi:hypothetical protein